MKFFILMAFFIFPLPMCPFNGFKLATSTILDVTYPNSSSSILLVMNQGCHNLMDVKFKDFSMTFQDPFKQIQDLLYRLELECFTFFFKTQFNNTYTILTSLIIRL